MYILNPGRSAVVQTWRFYDFNLKIVETCGSSA